MTFTELVTEIAARCNLTSTEAIARIGRGVNSRYKRVTSTIGLVTSRRTSVQATATMGVQTLTFSGIEKILAVFSRANDRNTVLGELTAHEMREVSPATSDSVKRYAIHRVGPDSATILMDVLPQTAITLYADGLETADTLSGALEPDFPESFHDILIEGVVSDELRKQEKAELASIAEKTFDTRLQELRLFLATSAYKEIQQNKAGTNRTTGSGSGSSGGSTPGGTSYTQTGLITFDRDPAAPFAVTPGSAVVPNLDADLLDGQHGAFYLDMANPNAGVLPVVRGGTGQANATQNSVFAAPDGSTGPPAFRSLVAADLPTGDANFILAAQVFG